jgi:3-oxoacyl-ACP reductase-like protein
MLEQAILENTAAIRDLIAAMAGNAAAAAPTVKATTGSVAKAVPIQAAAAAPATGMAAAEAPANIPYAAVKDAFLDVYKADVTKAKAVLAKFGVAKCPELKPEQYADVLAALKA